MLRVRSSRLTTVKPGLRSYVRASPLAAPQPGATFTCDFFEIDAIIDMDGSPGDSGAGYRAGFTQLQWIETNRAYYRGKMDADGSVNVERDRPPARPAQACRDVATPTDPFTYPPGAQALQGFMPTHPLNIDLAIIPSFPAVITLSHADSPSDFYPLLRTNSLTGRPNYLQWAQLEFHFCTVLMVRRQDGTLHQLDHFYWNVHWTDNFDLAVGAGGLVTGVTPRTAGARNVMNFGQFIAGGSVDPRFAPLVTAPNVTTCNTVANQETIAQVVKEKRHW